MPFKSEKQRRYMYANEPEIAKKWTQKYGSKIKKYRGGGMDASQDDFGGGKTGNTGGGRKDSYLGGKTSTMADYGYGPGKTKNPNPGQRGNLYGGPKSKSTSTKSKVTQTLFQPTPFVTVNLMKNLVFDPITKKSRTQKVRGETLFGKAKGLPASRDYYRSFGEPIDVMSKKGTDYMKEAGLITERKDTKQKDGPNLCPDGVSRPPCPPTSKPAKAQPAKPAPGGKPKSDFLKDFIFYPFNKGGGVPYGPPPERGPNPQVPPVKLRNGNLTKKYKMSCPHRPEGIRGVGKAIRGHKFTGVK